MPLKFPSAAPSGHFLAWGTRLAVVVLLSGCSSATDISPIQDYCDAEADNDLTCGRPPASTCDDAERLCFMEHIREDLEAPIQDCLRTRDCRIVEDYCFGFGLVRNAVPTERAMLFAERCLQSRETCDRENNGFAREYCTAAQVLADPTLAALEECLDMECTDVEACLGDLNGLCPGSVGPGVSGPPPFGNATWRTWCPPGAGNCEQGIRLDVMEHHGRGPAIVRCNVQEFAGGQLQASFLLNRFAEGQLYLVEGTLFTFPASGGAVTSGEVIFVNADESYGVADVAMGPPNSAHPCEATASIDRSDPSGPALVVNLRCEGVSNIRDRDARRTFASFTSASEPATIRIQDCGGL